jgi:hypothetical protein
MNRTTRGFWASVLAVIVVGLLVTCTWWNPPGPVPLPTATQTSGQTCGVYMEQGCNQLTVAGTGTLYVTGGATLTVEDGWTFGTLESVVFEGSTLDDNETTLSVTDPTADRAIVLPNLAGTVHVNNVAQALTALSGAFGGGYGDTGCTVSSAGVLSCDGAVTSDGVLTAASEVITAGATFGGGYGFTGCTISTAGALSCNDAIIAGGGYGSSGCALSAAGVLQCNSTSALDGAVTVGTGVAADVTLIADPTGGNAGAKSEYIGLPRIKLIGGGQGTNPASQTLPLVDDSPTGEFEPVDANVVEAEGSTDGIYKYGASSYKAAFDSSAAAGDGFLDSNLGAAGAWDDMESAGLLLYSSVTIASGDLTLVLTDNGGARTYSIPAITAANTWTWVEVDISTGDLSAISDVAILLSSQGATNLAAFNLYVDIGYVWDSLDEEALGVAIQQDGVLGVINTETGAALAELTDYIVHYESGSDFIVYITDQSAADIAALVAY